MKNKIKCIVVDDEKEAREGLAMMVSEVDELELIEVCRNGIEAVEKINEFNPDLVLLDIQMPYLNGFEVLQHLHHQPTAIIFITAFDEFALKAFEVHAVDYLLKPFSDERFADALSRAKEKVRQKNRENYSSLISHTASSVKDSVMYEKESSEKPERIVIKSDSKLHFISINEIIWIEAYDYYIKVHVQEKYFLVRETMKNMELKLPGHIFARIHKSSIVNINHILRIEAKLSASELILTGNKKLKISRTFKSALIEKLNAG